MQKMSEAVQSVMGMFNNPKAKEAMQVVANRTAEENADFINNLHSTADASAYQSIINTRRKDYERFSVWGTMGKQSFSFEQWHPEWQTEQEKALGLKRQAWKLAQSVATGSGRNILVYGNAGTGKTALVLAMLHHIQEQSDKTVMFISIATLAEKLHQFKDDQVQQRVRHIKDLMQTVDVLVIDDFGTEIISNKASDTLQRFYFQVGEARQARDEQGQRVYTTIVTTNFSPREVLGKYDPKIISRLIGKRPENQLNFKGLTDMRD